ncbi:MAG: hypothetical protein HZB67_05030 [Candidatus Aenigmarchaeota archaeon]|nr:hypothetical protein [Candidatus Aenigmarchaeota archaeon]
MPEENLEHHEPNHEQPHHEAPIPAQKTKLDYWKITTLVVMILFAISVFTGGFSSWGLNSKDKVAAEAVALINKNLLQGQVIAELKSVGEQEGLYSMKLNINGKDLDTYITRDGSLFFPQAIKLAEIPELPTAGETTPETIPKTDKPKVQLYVMSFCPFGNKAEETMHPVYQLLKDKVEWEVHYIVGVNGNQVQSLHGQPEADQNMREVCVKENYGLDKFWKFVSYVNQNCGSNGACWKDAAKSIDVDSAKIEDCVSKKGLDYMKAEQVASEAANAQGSPTLIINGVQSSSVYNYGNSNAYLKSICSAFSTPLAECSVAINSTAAAASAAAQRESCS